MNKIALRRHGEPICNKGYRLIGRFGLTEQGHAEAAALAYQARGK